MAFPALLIGRGGSRGVFRKNVTSVLGRPLMTYPILAAQHSKYVSEIFLSTDDDEIAQIGSAAGARLIKRPAQLATSDALVEDVVIHGFHEMAARLGAVPEIFTLLLCNSATITPGIIDAGVEMLLTDRSLDSALTVSRYNEYSPVRARRVDNDGLLAPFLSIDTVSGASCDRDGQGDVYFVDGGAWILRDRCMDLEYGVLPFRWTGRRMAPLYQKGGLDVDYPDGLVRTQHWLEQIGFSHESTPYELSPQATHR